MAWFDNIKNAMHPYDDDYIENEERAAEDELAAEEDTAADESFEERQPRPVFSRRESKASAPPPAPDKGKMKLHLVNPSEFGEAAEIADSLKSRQAVLMNLEMADDVTARRMIDFLSGVAYALGGKIMRVSGQAYIVTPTNVDLVGDAVSDFESAGLYF
ncbi:MAG: cell division protein SepF [Oscillospiraceae bacterium]|nr:cell division protein SepF [Oscillospiraceae bacterium]